jgi:tRNA threonylcarbamoyladenosine biosynthesis protein TsaB
MSKIIAIDTALSSCSVALSDHGSVSSLREHEPRQHVRLVLPMVEEVLKQGGLSINDIDAIGFNQGPGSFTGLRIGLGVVQGLAFGANMRAVPVSTLQTMAQAAIDHTPVSVGDLVMPLIDARMNEVYWGIYKNIDGRAQSVCADALNIPEDVGGVMLDLNILEQAANNNIAVGVGDGWQFRDRVTVRPDVINEQLTSDAVQVLALAVDAYEHGLSVSIEQVEPLYLRNEVSWTKRQRLRKPNK